MGSFAYTCCISGLPIHGGDEVRYFLLTQNPFYKKIADVGTMTGIWVPRTFALRARYDDYGRATGIEEGFAKKVWVDGFQYDLLERGTGDNSVHDVPVRKSMSFDKLMLAIREGRLRVKMTTLLGEKLDKAVVKTRGLLNSTEGDLPKVLEQIPSKVPLSYGIPTIKRVRRILRKAGFKVSDQGFTDGYLVNRKSFGFIRVRTEYNEEALEKLAPIQPVLGERFGVEVSIGTGVYSKGPMLVVTPKFDSNQVEPMSFEDGRKFRAGVDHKKLTVTHAMVREDVWQALLRINPAQVERFKKLAWEMHEYKGGKPLYQFKLDDNPVSAWLREEYLIGHLSHYLLFLENNPSKDELSQFTDTIAEMVFIESILSNTRYMWRPSTSVGPQFGEWGLHVAFLRALTGVAEQCYSAEQEDLDDGSESSI
jgi:hypothetical protein